LSGVSLLEFADVIHSERQVVWLTQVAAALIMIGLLYLTVRRGLLSLRTLVVNATLALLFTGAFWFSTHWDDIWSAHAVNWNVSGIPDFVLFGLFILLPSATMPLTLHWARHR
jgi:hypothetical protein